MINFLVECTADLKVILKLAHTILGLIQFAVPILLIILGSWDLGKAVIQSDEKKIKEQQQIFIKRLIAAILVFLVTIIVNIAIGLLPDSGNISGQDSWKTCWEESAR